MGNWWKSTSLRLSVITIAVGAVLSIVDVIAGTEVVGVQERDAVVLIIAGAATFIIRLFFKEPVA